MIYSVTIRGRVRIVEVTDERVLVDGKEYRADLRVIPGTPLRLLTLDGVTFPLAIENTGRHTWVVGERGDREEVEALDERAAHLRSMVGASVSRSGPGELKAPMPGLVVRVLVEPGQKVTEGASLLVLEAMKMENQLKATGPASIERIHVQAGQAVEKGTVLVTLGPA